MAERDLLSSFVARAKLAQAKAASSAEVVLGSGDDAAVTANKGLRVTSVDTTVAGIHLPDWHATNQPRTFGRRAVVTALSDLAAMGARPTEVYVALVLPSELEDPQISELMEGCLEACLSYRTTLCGGDLTSGLGLSASVTAVGEVDSADDLLLRSGARAGDLVGVSGSLGGSAAGLRLVLAEQADELPPVSPVNLDPQVRDALVSRYLNPHARFDLGTKIRSLGASSCMDLSDGLASDAEQIAQQSNVRILIDVDSLPRQAGVDEVAHAQKVDPEWLAACGGEDYELIITAPPEAVQKIDSADLDITWVGAVQESIEGAGSGLTLKRGSQVLQWAGFEHRSTN